MSENNVNLSGVSKPFIVSAVILVFAGSIIGSMWMMSLTGLEFFGFMRNSFSLHKTFQVDGFLVLLIMGVGYMIVPRFRNIPLASSELAYSSFIMVIFSITATLLSAFTNWHVSVLASFTQLIGVSIFSGILIWTLRVHPKLLRIADYFIGLSVVILVVISLFHLIQGVIPIGEVAGAAERGSDGNQLSQLQMLLLFAILMIFGVEYKTLPSFLGFVRPRKKLAVVSFGLGVLCVILGVFSMINPNILLAEIFNIVLLAFTIAFAAAVYIFGGFDNTEIMRILRGERKARYSYISRHLSLAFLFLFGGIVLAGAFYVFGTFMLYDLAIHYTAIGFLGITIALYLPLMLPPITGRMMHFTKFSALPLILVVLALVIRTTGHILMTTQVATVFASYIFMASGWMVVAALFAFITMIHRSAKHEEVINES
ncbi:MAG: hypothetical protein M3270_11380 [Thermoproteota archaeon]|nr:hypothetical protein [Thermoproteota archaeon]